MKKYLSAYTIIHFLIDFACIFYMYFVISEATGPDGSFHMKAVVYNLLAFALPMLLGLICDVLNRDEYVAAFGALLVVIAYVIRSVSWPAVVLLGLGNGLYHIGAGRKILLGDKKHFAPSGIFISSGAMGVFLGKYLGLTFKKILFVIVFILVIAGLVMTVLVLVSGIKGKTSSESLIQAVGHCGKSGNLAILPAFAAILVFVVVIIRSYYGFLGNYSWKNGFAMGFIFTLCVVGGKATGGIIADRIGILYTSIISLAGAGILALFAPKCAICGCVSIWLFNMTMPLTLKLLADIIGFAPGFAFGTLMMALFIGTVPGMIFGRVDFLSTPAGMMILCLISLVLLGGASAMFYGRSRIFGIDKGEK